MSIRIDLDNPQTAAAFRDALRAAIDQRRITINPADPDVRRAIARAFEEKAAIERLKRARGK